jgi:hypothetical protein
MISKRTIVTLESGIFDKAVREQKISTLVSAEAREFKDLTQQRIIEGPQTGRRYKRRGRVHIASARGQRPARDTGVLFDSIEDASTSPTTAEVSVSATRNGFDYPGHLQEVMERPIMSEQDAEEAGQKMVRDSNEMLKSLI